MKAITVIEDEDGVVTVVASGDPTFAEGLALLHQAILDVTRTEKGD